MDCRGSLVSNLDLPLGPYQPGVLCPGPMAVHKPSSEVEVTVAISALSNNLSGEKNDVHLQSGLLQICLQLEQSYISVEWIGQLASHLSATECQTNSS